MDKHELIPLPPAQAPFRYGTAQRSGAMTVVPLFGPDHDGRFQGPISGLKLSQVRGYGNMELSNGGDRGIAIVPLHMGYIQDKAQNHALCTAAFLAAGQKRMFEDACCVQQAQGGYLEGREQWFFILPVQLRAAALELRGVRSFNKLWNAIAGLNQRFGLPARGHLEQIISRSRPVLMQYQNRFELLPKQTGALFFVGERLAGLELAPSAAYFREVWPALVCFSYGVAAFYEERNVGAASLPEPFRASSLPELRRELERGRADLEAEVDSWLQSLPNQQWQSREEERLLDLRLYTIEGADLAGQVAHDESGVVYASVFARPEYLHR